MRQCRQRRIVAQQFEVAAIKDGTMKMLAPFIPMLLGVLSTRSSHKAVTAGREGEAVETVSIAGVLSSAGQQLWRAQFVRSSWDPASKRRYDV